MNVLVFNSEIKGHILEYIHHLYEYAQETSDNYFFIVPCSFSIHKEKLSWGRSDNIKIVYLTKNEETKCNSSNLLRGALWKSIIIRKYVIQYNIDRVWLIMLMLTMPLLPFFLPRKCKTEGILYRLYFYDGSNITGLRRLLEIVRFLILSHHPRINRVFVLNDSFGANQLNKKYRTWRFKYLPDPVPCINSLKTCDIRTELKISKDKKIYLHFGGLTRRKGTLEILHAIERLAKESLNDKVFIFAGAISDDIRQEFYLTIQQLRTKTNIFVFDDFCSYDFLFSLCKYCDYILIPYQNTNQSSGVIGYASFFEKPVIGPQNGLLGRLIKEYDLGYTIKTCCSEDIATSILDFERCSTSNRYYMSHRIENFKEVWKEGK